MIERIKDEKEIVNKKYKEDERWKKKG